MITRVTGVLSRAEDEEVRLQIGAFEYQGDGPGPVAARGRLRPVPDLGPVLARVPPPGDGLMGAPAGLASLPGPSPGAIERRPGPVEAAVAPPVPALDQWFAALVQKPPVEGTALGNDLEPPGVTGPLALAPGSGDAERLP